jgi:hypothetical protein
MKYNFLSLFLIIFTEDEKGIDQHMFLSVTVLCTEQISINMFA